MNLQKNKLGLFVMLATVAGVVLPAEAATKLENVKVNDQYASQTKIELQFDGPIGSYQDRLQYQPEQLIINLSDAESALLKDSLDVNVRGINKMNVTQNGDGLDVVFGLDSLVPYEVSQQNNSLYVTIGNDPRVTAARNGVTSSDIVKTNADRSVAGGINRINGLSFKKNSAGDGLVVVNLDNKSAALDLQNKGSHLIAKFHGTNVAPDLLAVMDVADYATQVKSIDVSQTADGAVLDMTMYNSEYDAKYDQSGETIVINVAKKKPVIKLDNTQKYSGKLISLSFQDVPVRSALKVLAQEVNLNLVMNDSVGGNITINFDSVPWDQALDTILRVKGLDKRVEGTILLIGSQDELAQYEQKQLEEQDKKTAKEPLVTEFIQVNYAKAADFVKLISTKDSELSIRANSVNNINGSSGADSNDSLLSARGTVTVDERTNTLIIKDTEASIANIKRLVETLDTPVQQVVIEARIVSIDESAETALGINWQMDTNNGTLNTGKPNNSEKWYAGSGTQTDVPADGGTFSLGRITKNFAINLALKALETEKRTDIISSPRITTTNQKEAYIEQGYEIPSITSASSGATTIEWKKAVLSLKVTPQITPDDSVFLDLKITQDDKGDEVKSFGTSSLSIETRELETQVLVGNGETLVLGGIFQQSVSRTVKKVPLLGDIPVLGWLFKSVDNTNSKREVLVFITPHILKEAM
ncbi:type IV pilus secretin PilQ [uncultured Ruminobacter sp.]|uniref:type IV pilus secretin PilQ n=1 Tax=uncultured Ruminobacter sp. TaxID=538947 RepID=UPI0025DC8170|nr:type IV pilus secretin PilQ [uncultured Ruminobacter sp.]